MSCCLYCPCFQRDNNKKQSIKNNQKLQETNQKYYQLKLENSKQEEKIIELENKEKEQEELIKILKQENSELKEKNSELSKKDSDATLLDNSNSSLSSSLSNSSKSKSSFIKIKIKFNDKNYELDVKNKYSLSRVYDIFVKKYELKPNGHFFIGNHEDDCPLCKTIGELKLIDGQILTLI